MFYETYPARYRDRFGEATTTIHNDGKELHMTLRGVKFSGWMLDDWEADENVDDLQLQQFKLHRRELCDFILEFAMPIPVYFQTERLQGTLHVQLTLGGFLASGALDQEILCLRLDVAGFSFSSGSKRGWFEDELLDISRQLPEGMYLQACITCAFSDYHPVGQGIFGGMACFRDNKQQYLAVQSKYDLMRLWDTRTEYVQETYRCDEFEKRVPGTGYRG